MGQVSGPQGLREASQDFGQPWKVLSLSPPWFPTCPGWRLGPVVTLPPSPACIL